MGSVGFGLAMMATLIQLAIYCAIAFVIWKFYQMISKIGEDIAAIRKHLKPPSIPGAEPDFDVDLELPSDHPLA